MQEGVGPICSKEEVEVMVCSAFQFNFELSQTRNLCIYIMFFKTKPQSFSKMYYVIVPKSNLSGR